MTASTAASSPYNSSASADPKSRSHASCAQSMKYCTRSANISRRGSMSSTPARPDPDRVAPSDILGIGAFAARLDWGVRRHRCGGAAVDELAEVLVWDGERAMFFGVGGIGQRRAHAVIVPLDDEEGAALGHLFPDDVLDLVVEIFGPRDRGVAALVEHRK